MTRPSNTQNERSMKIIFSFVADKPGKFEVRRGAQLIGSAFWGKGDLVLVVESGHRLVIPRVSIR